MNAKNYKIGKYLNTLTKYDTNFNRTQILNLMCANYVESVLLEGSAFNIDAETEHELLLLMDKLLK